MSSVKEVSRIPPPIMQASTSNFTLGHLVFTDESGTGVRPIFKPDGTEWLLGHRLPPFQRPAIWTVDQKIRFLTSCWSGVHLGTYVVNRVDEWKDNHPHFTDLWLIDGQQRLRALASYFKNEFAVFGLHWADLNELERRIFDNITFSCSVVQVKSEEKLRLLYDLLNFGGTPHTEDQRAS